MSYAVGTYYADTPISSEIRSFRLIEKSRVIRMSLVLD